MTLNPDSHTASGHRVSAPGTQVDDDIRRRLVAVVSANTHSHGKGHFESRPGRATRAVGFVQSSRHNP